LCDATRKHAGRELRETPESERLLEKARLRCRSNIKMCVKETG
jgi:hypothetical protein